jgi:hypothetical protein
MRPGYDWRQDPVSSLRIGDQGCPQRATFAFAGGLYLLAASGMRRCPQPIVGPRVVPALVAAADVGLVGSGSSSPIRPVTSRRRSPANMGPRAHLSQRSAESARTRAGQLHNLSAIPIFAGPPVAALASALGAVRQGNLRWAASSAVSDVTMVASFAASGAALGPGSRLTGKGACSSGSPLRPASGGCRSCRFGPSRLCAGPETPARSLPRHQEQRARCPQSATGVAARRNTDGCRRVLGHRAEGARVARHPRGSAAQWAGATETSRSSATVTT